MVATFNKLIWYTTVVFAITVLSLTTSCNNASEESTTATPVNATPASEPEYTDGGYTITSYYPFSVLDDPRNTIAVYLYNEEDSVLIKYTGVFEKYGYSGNGESWAGHIVQILEKVEPSLLSHIEFDPEADAFFAYADTKANQKRFIEVLTPIFTDMALLEKYIASANSNRIWD